MKTGPIDCPLKLFAVALGVLAFSISIAGASMATPEPLYAILGVLHIVFLACFTGAAKFAKRRVIPVAFATFFLASMSAHLATALWLRTGRALYGDVFDLVAAVIAGVLYGVLPISAGCVALHYMASGLPWGWRTPVMSWWRREREVAGPVGIRE